MPEGCNYSRRHLPCLMKSCFPTTSSATTTPHHPQPLPLLHPFSDNATSISISISSLPDDLLLDCLSRLPSSSLPHLSLVCRRWSQLLRSPAFSLIRRRLGLLCSTLFAVSVSDSRRLLAAYQRLSGHDDDETSAFTWNLTFLPVHSDAVFKSLTHWRALVAVGRRIYILGLNVMLLYDPWTATLAQKLPTLFPRKKFAAAVVAGKIYVAGGASRTATLEEYDPETDEWRVVTNAPRRRYGCFGASVDGVFYMIGGLKVAPSSCDAPPRATAGSNDALAYARSMDVYDVEAGVWLRSRSVPGGGCVVAACSAGGYLFVLASHAVELSFWRFDARRKGGAFGEWNMIRSPPLPAQVRVVDGSVRFRCVGVGENKVVLVQATGCIDDLLRRCGRSERGLREGLVLVYDGSVEEWRRGPDLPEVVRRAACVCVEC